MCATLGGAGVTGAPQGSDALSPDADQPDEFALSPGLQAAMSDMNEAEHLDAARKAQLDKLIAEKTAELKKKVPSICPARTHCDYNRPTRAPTVGRRTQCEIQLQRRRMSCTVYK
jgi:hypothetical protein